MVETEQQVTELAEGLHRVLTKLVSVLRRGDPSRVSTSDLTLAQLSILGAVLVDITDKGLAVHRESLANRRAALASMLATLSDDDRETLVKALIPLERLAGESGHVEPAR